MPTIEPVASMVPTSIPHHRSESRHSVLETDLLPGAATPAIAGCCCVEEMESRNPYLFPKDLITFPSTRSETSVSSGDLITDAHEVVLNQAEWWLIHTKPRQEKKLVEEMRIRSVPHYLPVTYCKSLTRGRGRYSWLPLFPGYLFLKCTSEQRLMALQTNRIVATHRIADTRALEQQLAVLADLIQKGVPLRIEERIVAGQEVQVKAGLLKGKRGIVMKRSGRMRLFIFVAELLGGVSLEIEHHYVEPF